ncbi:MAG: TatD family hydrolase [Bacillota bacterium]|nr:TatD family hydrolase [Bacillota bacterium]
MLFDSHAHYDDEKFDADRYEVIEKLHNEGVGYVVNAASNLPSAIDCITLAQRYDFVYAAIGIHPQDVSNINENTLATVSDFAGHERVVAIGEIGLDYYYENSPRDVQQYWFSRQISMARDLKLPVVIHDRDAHEDTLKIIKQEKAGETGGVLHCFSGSVEMALELIENNFYISFGGTVTFKNARKSIEVVKAIPEDRLLLETDSPYLAPEPFRGKRNYSGYLKYIAQKVADIKGVSYERIAQITTENAKKLFGISS